MNKYNQCKFSESTEYLYPFGILHICNYKHKQINKTECEECNCFKKKPFFEGYKP